MIDNSEDEILQIAAARRLRWRIARWGTVIVTFFIIFANQVLGWQPGGLHYIILVVVFACVLWIVLNWRCPACGAFLGLNRNPKNCTKCQVKLRN
jgi:hypothetical protein